MIKLLGVGFVLAIAFTTIIFFIGYSILFIHAFSNKRLSVVFLILLGVSAPIFMLLGLSPYYSIILWFIPVLYSQVVNFGDKKIKKASILFWLGLLLAIAVGLIFRQLYLLN